VGPGDRRGYVRPRRGAGYRGGAGLRARSHQRVSPPHQGTISAGHADLRRAGGPSTITRARCARGKREPHRAKQDHLRCAMDSIPATHLRPSMPAPPRASRLPTRKSRCGRICVRELKLVVEPGGRLVSPAMLAGAGVSAQERRRSCCSGGNVDADMFAKLIRLTFKENNAIFSIWLHCAGSMPADRRSMRSAVARCRSRSGLSQGEVEADLEWAVVRRL